MSNKEKSDGARALREYLDRRELSITEFCKVHEIERVHVQRVLRGARGTRVTVNFAKKIHDATHGKVRWDSWVTESDDTPVKKAG